ncbi:heterokaryon incompatibility protein-domain-containing protein [Camillea tinctor]|nr:heterokaryon incompatibility protein-domain-containing protein [Camillea tinctor]
MRAFKWRELLLLLRKGLSYLGNHTKQCGLSAYKQLFHSVFWTGFSSSAPHTINLPTYQYTALPRNHIRVLELEAAADSADPLRCALILLDLDASSIPYDALSYTWGNPDFCHSVIVDGKFNLPITTSLFTALHRFRSAEAPRRIWADAVCINQKDNEEKSVQIPLMRSIYQGAAQVLVWLGNSEPRLLHQIMLHDRRFKCSTITSSELNELRNLLSQFICLPWFSRRWVIQEAVLNSTVAFFCGPAEVSWLALITMIKNILLPPTGPLPRLSEPVSLAATSCSAMFDLWEMWSFIHHTGEHQPAARKRSHLLDMQRLLHKFEHFGCADSRDILIAFSGLAKNIGPIPSRDEVARIGPDEDFRMISFNPSYTLSTKQLYTNFAAAAVKAGHWEWILEQAHLRNKFSLNTWPSWVPNWQYAAGTNFEHHFHDVSIDLHDDGDEALAICSFRGRTGVVLNHERQLPRLLWTSPSCPSQCSEDELIGWVRATFSSLLDVVYDTPQSWWTVEIVAASWVWKHTDLKSVPLSFPELATEYMLSHIAVQLASIWLEDVVLRESAIRVIHTLRSSQGLANLAANNQNLTAQTIRMALDLQNAKIPDHDGIYNTWYNIRFLQKAIFILISSLLSKCQSQPLPVSDFLTLMQLTTQRGCFGCFIGFCGYNVPSAGPGNDRGPPIRFAILPGQAKKDDCVVIPVTRHYSSGTFADMAPNIYLFRNVPLNNRSERLRQIALSSNADVVQFSCKGQFAESYGQGVTNCCDQRKMQFILQ